MNERLRMCDLRYTIICVSSVSATVINTNEHKWDSEKQKLLGKDGEAMTWYLGDYGKINDTPYVIVRRYYSGNAARYRHDLEKKISPQIKKSGIDTNLYFTEYGYEFTDDGKYFFEIYAKHYNKAGQFLHEEKTNETGKLNVDDNFGAKNSIKYAIASDNQTKNIDDGTTELLSIKKVDDTTGVHTSIAGTKNDDVNAVDVDDDDSDHESSRTGREWQYWNDVKDMWHKNAKSQLTNWTFTKNKTTVELVNKSGRKTGEPYTLTSVKDRGFVFSRGVEKGTQFVVPEGCEVHCDPSAVDMKGKGSADKRGNGVAFYPGEIVYYKKTVSPGFTIFPYHAYSIE